MTYKQSMGSYDQTNMLTGEGSNLQPPDSKSGVLPVELPVIVALACWFS